METSSKTGCTTGSGSTSHLQQSRWHAHLGITGTSRPPIHSKGSHLTSCSTNGTGLVHLKHTLRYIKGTLHYKFLISPRLPQGHSVPLRQLIPLHINTYCDADWATDIESRAQSHQYLEYLLHSAAEHSPQSQHHQRRLSSTPSASASATAYTSTSNIFNDKPSTSATSGLSTLSTTLTTRLLHHHH